MYSHGSRLKDYITNVWLLHRETSCWTIDPGIAEYLFNFLICGLLFLFFCVFVLASLNNFGHYRKIHCGIVLAFVECVNKRVGRNDCYAK